MSKLSLSDVVSGVKDTSPTRRSAVRARERRQRRKKRRSVLVLLVGLLMLGGACAGAYLAISPMVRSAFAPNDYTGSGTGQVQVVIPPGASGKTIAQVLAKAGVVKSAKAFVDAAKRDSRSAGIQPGTYQLRFRMSAAAALAALLDPSSKLELKVTIPEGTRVPGMLTLLSKGLGISMSSLQAALRDHAAIGLPASAKGNPEGYLFPATYSFQPGVSATEVLSAMVARGQTELQQLGIAPARMHMVLTEASLVQAESGSVVYMPRIARVIDNRLAKKIKLQLDTTVHYATGRFTLLTTTKDLQVNSPYNTYLHAGLPPGPIDSPGAAAIQAVLHPAAGPWLFFVTVNPDTGLTKFGTTPADQAKMKAEFKAWLAAHGQ